MTKNAGHFRQIRLVALAFLSLKGEPVFKRFRGGQDPLFSVITTPSYLCNPTVPQSVYIRVFGLLVYYIFVTIVEANVKFILI